MTTVRAAGILLGKELRLEFRSRELLSATIIFALVVVVLFSFAFDPTAAESRRYGPGLLWIAFLFAGSLMLNPSFSREQANETLDALRMAPISPFAVLLGKMLANFIFMSVAELILAIGFGTRTRDHRADRDRHGILRSFRARPDAGTPVALAAAADSYAAADCFSRIDRFAFSGTARARPDLGRVSGWI
jgi:hypothetical protein